MQVTRRLVVDIKGVISREQKCSLILLNHPHDFMKIFHWIAKARMIISATSIHIEHQQAKANSKTEEEGYEIQGNK